MSDEGCHSFLFLLPLESFEWNISFDTLFYGFQLLVFSLPLFKRLRFHFPRFKLF